VGNADYAKQNKSYGLTTLRDPHVKVEGAELKFQFKGKSGKTWRLSVKDRRIARIVKACQDLPGQDLFQYLDAAGERQSVTSADVNAYLKEITGRDITAKDFRTWAGTVLAAMALSEFEEFDSQAKAKKNLRAAIEKVSSRLGNTPTICRKCYVHPEVFTCYLEGALLLEIRNEVEEELREGLADLKPEEAAVMALLEERLSREIEKAEGKAEDKRKRRRRRQRTRVRPRCGLEGGSLRELPIHRPAGMRRSSRKRAASTHVEAAPAVTPMMISRRPFKRKAALALR
jgi:DNA topoisomerase-1